MNNSDQIKEFMQKKNEFDIALKRLQSLSDDHFNFSPESINWSSVADMQRYNSTIKELTDVIFNEGEYE